ncbi:MAG TPA: AraC family transcriptional regulator [Firmicutes bacterium]|nr:AraC family transcriptional regulator [Bacillota bacterium]
MAFLAFDGGSRVTVPAAGYILDTHRPWREREHSNPNYQLVLVEGGGVRFRRADDRLFLRHGDFLILMPNQVHQAWGQAEPSSGYCFAQFRTEPSPVYVTSNDTGGRLEAGRPNSEYLRLPLVGHVDSPQVHQRFKELIAEWTECLPFSKSRAGALLLDILALLARLGQGYETIKSDGTKETVLRRPTSPRELEIVRAVERYLQEHYREPINASVIGDALHLNYSYIERVFRKVVGMTIKAYLRSLRLREARKLLIELTEFKTVEEVAAAVGYSDPAYFSREFRRSEGMSPRQFIAAYYGEYRE